MDLKIDASEQGNDMLGILRLNRRIAVQMKQDKEGKEGD
jgi:hypothetical protein